MPGTNDRLRLAELLCARISHDLGGMIGTLAGAVEIADDPAVAAEALPLAQQAAVELRHRLTLLRASWGPVSAPLDLSELVSLFAGLPAARHCKLSIDGMAPGTVFAPPFARAALNLLLLAAESLHGAGEIALAGNETDLIVAIAGPRAAWPTDLAHCLTGDAAAWEAVQDARSIQMPLTVLLARAENLRLSFLMPPGQPVRAAPLRLTGA